MILSEAEDLAFTLMETNGIKHWNFKFDTAKRRFGLCQRKQQMISLSSILTELNDYEAVRDTILHEIAHALVKERGHGKEWKHMCLLLGIKPERCYDDKVKTPPRKWQGICPNCLAVFTRHNRVTGRWCRKCGREKGTIKWEKAI